MLETMRKYAGRTRWVYTPATLYPFHPNLCVIPELAVMPRKRFWSRQISEQQVLSALRRYHPEQLLLPATAFLDRETVKFITEDYVVAAQNSDYRLYVAKSLLEPDYRP